LEAAIDRLEAQVLGGTAIQAQTALESEEAKRAEITAKQQQMLIASLRKVEPLGRVVIHLDDPERLRGTPDDIALEEGDRLMIPQVQGTVNVVGAVFAPTALTYAPYRTVKQYIAMAGGTTEIANDKQIYVIKVNGAAVSRKGYTWLRVGGISSLTLDPGDTIVVPERLERIAWLKEIKDITTIIGNIVVIIGNIAVTAGIVLVGLRR
jgi:protein involved in polysaccharide export with SLBB domain